MILSSRLTIAPFRYLWITLGAISLGAITLGVFFVEWGPIAALREGGVERWNVYPIVLWLVAFGSYLMTGSPMATDRRRRGGVSQTAAAQPLDQFPASSRPTEEPLAGARKTH